jgi:hypothetical protein
MFEKDMKTQNVIIVLIVILFLMPLSAVSENQWYRGVVNRVSLLGADGTFLVTLDNGALSDCSYGYVRFSVGELGQDRVKMAYTLAITSLTTGRPMGVVIDKDLNGVDGDCYASGMTADLR